MTYKDFLIVCDRAWSSFNLELNKGRLKVDWQAENFSLVKNCKYLILFREYRGELRPQVVKVEDILNAELVSVDLIENTAYINGVFSQAMLKTFSFTDGTNLFEMPDVEGFNYNVYVKGEKIWYRRTNLKDIDVLAEIMRKRED